MALTEYNKKRNFKKTPEPKGKGSVKKNHFRFVVQRHDASRLHYDFRLELGGTLKSWAIPKGPSMNPADKRLAVMVEDHPVSYINFKGEIPEGNYGAGSVEIWDEGLYFPVDVNQEKLTEREALNALEKGELKLFMKGDKLEGEFVLVRMQGKNWLLIKHKDEYAVKGVYDSEKFRKQAPGKKKAQKNNATVIVNSSAVTSRKVPGYIVPMLTTAIDKPFSGEGWIFELKLDGYRAIAEISSREILFYSRNGLSFANRFPRIVDSLKKIKKEAILDGEVILLNEDNRPDFQKLQHYETNKRFPLVYYVFDLLSLEGEDLKRHPLSERKKRLKKLLGKNSILRYSDHIEENGAAFFNKVASENMEGIIAKKADSYYSPGIRSREWLKIKNQKSQEAIIAGFTAPKGSRIHFGSLLLGQFKGKDMVYIGHAGTGFTDSSLKELRKKMEPYIVSHSPFPTKIPANGPVTWLKPALVCEVSYSEITRDGILRHPVYKGLRPDKRSKDIRKETEVPKPVEAVVKKKHS